VVQILLYWINMERNNQIGNKYLRNNAWKQNKYMVTIYILAALWVWWHKIMHEYKYNFMHCGRLWIWKCMHACAQKYVGYHDKTIKRKIWPDVVSWCSWSWLVWLTVFPISILQVSTVSFLIHFVFRLHGIQVHSKYYWLINKLDSAWMDFWFGLKWDKTELIEEKYFELVGPLPRSLK
jgi:hypothetical protein